MNMKEPTMDPLFSHPVQEQAASSDDKGSSTPVENPEFSHR